MKRKGPFNSGGEGTGTQHHRLVRKERKGESTGIRQFSIEKKGREGCGWCRVSEGSSPRGKKGTRIKISVAKRKKKRQITSKREKRGAEGPGEEGSKKKKTFQKKVKEAPEPSVLERKRAIGLRKKGS